MDKILARKYAGQRAEAQNQVLFAWRKILRDMTTSRDFTTIRGEKLNDQYTLVVEPNAFMVFEKDNNRSRICVKRGYREDKGWNQDKDRRALFQVIHKYRTLLFGHD